MLEKVYTALLLFGDYIKLIGSCTYLYHILFLLNKRYRRIDDDRGKSYELGQSTVKCMRGILECWIRQSARIELFKKNQCSTHALHVKFHLIKGDEIYSDAQYNHLQIDVISIYLIFLVQMITSGLQIIYTQVQSSIVINSVYVNYNISG